ncbi:histidine kinase [Campylobacter sp. JMF_04 NA10]|uniref:histidine kinase n=1 Tax=Campylobacter sp. JMF_04 NA10 TaxID=2983824 RepID=UPI0022E9E696|nr:histidine kinase [Campylobacter sp. JMF_04 NA10]MDA3076186.1 histidine kinase [Campylobacter sp. JMF_04 NA10]
MSYKSKGLNALKSGKFEFAKTFFALAQEQKPSDELLFLIELCDLGLSEPEEALMLYEFYTLKPKPKPSVLFRILNSINEKIAKKNAEISKKFSDEAERIDAILYKDFMRAVKESGSFKNVFESVIFSSKIAVENKDEMIEFLQNLLANGFDEICINYIEASSEHFAGDLRLDEIIKKIKNENRD